jgi:hypothetical protein
MRELLLTWYGMADFRASLELDSGEGPIAAALAAKPYSDVVVLCYTRADNDSPECRALRDSFAAALSSIREAGQPPSVEMVHQFVCKFANTSAAHDHFARWLEDKCRRADGAPQFSFRSETLRELNDTEGIYACAIRALDWVAQQPGEKLVTLYLSPGTPVMAFVWAIAALARPTLQKRLIASPVVGKPPATVALPVEWLERHGTAKVARQACTDRFDVMFHLFGEQRMPALLGIRQFEATRHVFVNSPQYPAICMRRWVDNEFDELAVDPWDASAVREQIVRHASRVPAQSRIAMNLTGGTKLMFAGALAAARAIGAVPFYVDGRNRRVVFVDDLHSEPLKPIHSVETFLLLHGDGLTLSKAGEVPVFAPDRLTLTSALWKKRSLLAKRYGEISKWRVTRSPFRLHCANCCFELDSKGAVSVLGDGLQLRFEHWPDFATYLSGGWFEEYVCQCLKPYEESGTIKDVRLNVELELGSAGAGQLKEPGIAYNELDVAFTDGYSLYIVECKAGAVNQDQIMKLQNLVRFYGGVGGRGVVAGCFPPSRAPARKIADAGLLTCFGEGLREQIKGLMGRIRKSRTQSEVAG